MRWPAAALTATKIMTLQEWSELDEDVEGELVDGVLEEEEIATFLHELVVMWLARILGTWARRRRQGFVAGSEAKIAVGPRRGRKPDLSVYLRGRAPVLTDALVRTPPHIVVEVVSPRPSDARRDRVEKISDYARAGKPGMSMTGRTSTVPLRAIGMRPAMAMASSRSLASTRK